MTPELVSNRKNNFSMPAVGGLHHVTAITGRAQENIDFYTQVLGLRLVKLTVNYDDPSSYHLYYGDATGSPGTLLTFFVWPGGQRGRTGTGQVTHTAFNIPAASLNFWEARLRERNIVPAGSERFGQPVLSFSDPDQMAVELIGDALPEQAQTFPGAPVPAEHAIRGFHGVTLRQVRVEDPASVLVDHFGYKLSGQIGNRHRFALGGAKAGTIDVVATSAREFTGGGAGSVHHIAFRTPDDQQQAAWLKLLQTEHANVSPVMDREYFHSIYFREPGGVLFEIATDNPGMNFNESTQELGTQLMLPTWAEKARDQIEAVLPRVVLPNGKVVGRVA